MGVAVTQLRPREMKAIQLHRSPVASELLGSTVR